MTDTSPSVRNDTALFSALSAMLGDRFQRGEAIRAQHGHTTTHIPVQPPDAVAFPQSTDEVSRIVSLCARDRVPIIPFGTGTSLEGHVNAPRGGLCLDLSRMADVIALDAADLDVRVQAGITRKALNTHLRDQGLFFPVDPGADASLGGMASTRASGTGAVRYGTMRENVLALTAVMADGTVVRTGSRARKSSAGYDLTRLLVGAEGTLGVITELVLRLHPIPEAISAARASFPTLTDAARAVSQTIGYGLPVARIELMDPLTVRAVNAYSKLTLPEAPLLLLEFHGTPAAVAEQAALFAEIAAETGGTGIEKATDAEERARLWQARHDVYWAGCALRPGARHLSTDVCVPISRLTECIGAAQDKLSELGLAAPIVGHAGDGNFHVLLSFDEHDRGEYDSAMAFVGWLNGLAISLDGTCTGEHGIGQGKMSYLEAELGSAIPYMAAIKAALDPLGIMNPGKIFPASARPGQAGIPLAS